jgi:hypothetical protein
MNALLQDSRYALRQLIKTPGVTLVALLSLAFGIGANTAIFSLIDSLMLKSLPVREPPQLVLFGDGLDQGISDGFPNPWLYSYPFYREMRKRNQVFSDVAAAFSMVDRVHGFVENRSEAEPMSIQLVSGTYFPMLGVRPLIGRGRSPGRSSQLSMVEQDAGPRSFSLAKETDDWNDCVRDCRGCSAGIFWDDSRRSSRLLDSPLNAENDSARLGRLQRQHV